MGQGGSKGVNPALRAAAAGAGLGHLPNEQLLLYARAVRELTPEQRQLLLTVARGSAEVAPTGSSLRRWSGRLGANAFAGPGDTLGPIQLRLKDFGLPHNKLGDFVSAFRPLAQRDFVQFLVPDGQGGHRAGSEGDVFAAVNAGAPLSDVGVTTGLNPDDLQRAARLKPDVLALGH